MTTGAGFIHNARGGSAPKVGVQREPDGRIVDPGGSVFKEVVFFGVWCEKHGVALQAGHWCPCNETVRLYEQAVTYE